MSITDRDRKIMIVIVPLLLIVAYWFLLLAPKRQEAADAGTTLAKAEERLDAAEDLVAQKQQAKTSFASDYSELIRLGKAIPTSLDMPSLIVQLDSAARGTHIKFRKIATAAPTGAAAATPAAASAPAQGSQPAAAGGQAAQSGPGKATEAAGNATGAANASSGASNAQASGVDAKDTQTSSSAREGLPVGGGSAASAASATGGQTCAPGLVCVPLTMEFTGGFFDLTDFFHKLKRFVKVADSGLKVNGRLMTIDTLKFATDPQSFPSLKAEIGATVYLAPKAQGTTAGATPQGPPATTPAGASQPAGSSPTTTTSAPSTP